MGSPTPSAPPGFRALRDGLGPRVLPFPDPYMAPLPRPLLPPPSRSLLSPAEVVGFHDLSGVSGGGNRPAGRGNQVERSLKQFDSARDEVLAEITARTQAA